jgi:hypothetical protein
MRRTSAHGIRLLDLANIAVVESVEYGFVMSLSFNNVIIIIIMNTIYFPEPSSVLPSMFFHFEPDNDLQTGVHVCSTSYRFADVSHK